MVLVEPSSRTNYQLVVSSLLLPCTPYRKIAYIYSKLKVLFPYKLMGILCAHTGAMGCIGLNTACKQTTISYLAWNQYSLMVLMEIHRPNSHEIPQSSMQISCDIPNYFLWGSYKMFLLGKLTEASQILLVIFCGGSGIYTYATATSKVSLSLCV